MSDENIEITKDLTIPQLFYRQCKKYGSGKVAMREKEFGIWRPSYGGLSPGRTTLIT